MAFASATRRGRRAAYRTKMMDLLLAKVGGNPDSPFFQSQAQLAKVIVGLNLGYQESTLRSYLNQVLIGRKRCNEKLANSLVAAVRTKVKNKGRQIKIEGQLRGAIEQHNELEVAAYYARFPEEITTGDIVDKIKDKQRKCESVTIITVKPLEPMEALEDRPKELLEITINDIYEGHKKYFFCVPDEESARETLKSLHRALSKKFSDKEQASVLIQDRENEGLLKFYVLPAVAWIPPTVVYDADSPKAEGYIWFVAWDETKAIDFPPQFLDRWTDNFFIKMRNESLPDQKPYSWKEVVPK